MSFVTKDQKAKTVVRILYEQFISVFGMPTKLLSDRGANFTSALVEELLIGTVYHNYHHSALIVIFIFPGLLPKILRPSSQEHTCPTRTYACLAKHNSK